ncbi:efflux RND transporter periplasmic adaptor subunit [Fundidesulfovibrio agrisoli]|uniref:efflux RND transporter periplasmic adaptor subunit n=1 Tax=Fundidesulfovibrio agrisoli TaxID=2922717 RepID=UPI001FADE105|nr:efflux RND transporter periplasmic adaptor subunit [Fundidesulfovibrio agrisoli]
MHASATRLPLRLTGLAAALILLAVLAACDKRNAYVPPPPPKVTVAKPVRQSVVDYLEFTGNTQAVQTVNLNARVEGFLQGIFYEDGARVKQGQKLFLIEPAPYKAKVDRAKADLDSQKAQLVQAETELTRSKKLFAERAGPDTEVVRWQRERDTAVANVEAAKANLQIAEINLGYTSVTAPFDGRVSRRQVDLGNLVGSGGQATQLATIVKDDPIYAYFTLNERDMLRVERVNQARQRQSAPKRVTVEMGLSDQSGYPLKGEFDYYDIGVDPQTGTILLRGVFPNPKGDIVAGLFVRLRAALETREALTVPEACVGVDQVGSYVLVVDDKNLAQQRPVTTGQAVNGLRVIDKGLDGTERVIVNGMQRARPGAPVAPEEAKQ